LQETQVCDASPHICSREQTMNYDILEIPLLVKSSQVTSGIVSFWSNPTCLFVDSRKSWQDSSL